AARGQGHVGAQHHEVAVALAAGTGDVLLQHDEVRLRHQAGDVHGPQDQGVRVADRDRATVQRDGAIEAVVPVGQGDIATGDQRRVAADLQRAGLDDRATLAVRVQRARDDARSKVQQAVAGGRQGAGGERAQGQGVVVADRDHAAGQRNRAAEVVAPLGEADAGATGVERAGPAHGQRAGLGDRLAVAVGLEVAGDDARSEVQGSVAGDVQVAGGERPQLERADVVDGDRVTGQRYRAGEAVARLGQVDV